MQPSIFKVVTTIVTNCIKYDGDATFFFNHRWSHKFSKKYVMYVGFALLLA